MEDLESSELEREIVREKQDLARNEKMIQIEKQNFASYLQESGILQGWSEIQPTIIERLDVMPWYKRIWCKFKSLF